MESRNLSFPMRLPGTARPLSPDTQAGGGDTISPWLRFNWQTAGVVALPEGSDQIRRATREESEEVLRVLLLALSMDSAWNDAYAQTEQHLRASVSRLFNAEDPLCLVIPKGNRLIAASLLDPDPEASNHLASGPAILMEYRNRGIGTRLLQASLEALRGAGVATATGVTRDRTEAARYVYPKFGGKAERFRPAAASNS
jgi:GNAT superfamily N-acetyltransferase